MTSLTDRPQTALLVIDMQKKIVDGSPRREEVIANISSLVDRARDEGTPVVWVQHSDDEIIKDSDGWQYVDELKRNDDEPLVHKNYLDSFESTELESVLADRKVGRLVVTGAQTDACIRSTLHGALARGYDALLVEDAHTTEDMRKWGSPISPEDAITYTNLYWSFTRTEGAKGGTSPAAEVDFSPVD